MKQRHIQLPILTFLLSVPIAITAMDRQPEDQNGTEATSLVPVYFQLPTSYTYDAAGNRIRRKYEQTHLVHDSLPGAIVWSVGENINGNSPSF